MNRRSFLSIGFGAGICGVPSIAGRRGRDDLALTNDLNASSSFYSSGEVVGDGKWVWTKPPDSKTGYLEPRAFDFVTRISIQGTGPANGIKSTTVVPVELPEQKVEDSDIQTQGCAAALRRVSPTAGQLILAAPSIALGQTIGAVARFRLVLSKQHHGFKKEQFPAQQSIGKQFRKQFLFDSPGIQTRPKAVREIAEQVGGQFDHPWDKAQAFKKWVWENIEKQPGPYTSVVEAIRNRKGDCEERASVFAAFCRIHGIPTRTVWVPNHVWAEFYLKDHDGKGHWIPAHTSGYTWFGYTGAHELIMQKGDEVRVPEQRKSLRFIHDWAQWTGARPVIQYAAQLTPLPPRDGSDPGPGGRIKPIEGPWKPGNHQLDKYLRDGEMSDESPFKKKKDATEKETSR